MGGRREEARIPWFWLIQLRRSWGHLQREKNGGEIALGRGNQELGVHVEFGMFIT